MLQSITWLILRKFKKSILIRKNHKLGKSPLAVVVVVVIALHLEF